MNKSSLSYPWPMDPWVKMFSTPRHKSVVCMTCQTTPCQAPGEGWMRSGTNPKTWKHLCPTCSAFTFESHDYLKFMPVVNTDQFAGRKHLCPICGRRYWSVWAHADKHWMSHAAEWQSHE